jgi:predicted nucleic acid-binding protein
MAWRLDLRAVEKFMKSTAEDGTIAIPPALLAEIKAAADEDQRSADDNRVIECAAAAGSGFIVSGDKHLLDLSQFRNVRIVKLADFMKLIAPP